VLFRSAVVASFNEAGIEKPLDESAGFARIGVAFARRSVARCL